MSTDELLGMRLAKLYKLRAASELLLANSQTLSPELAAGLKDFSADVEAAITAVQPEPGASREPLYFEIADHVRKRIKDGEVRPGDAVPVQPLSVRFDCHRQTVAKGLSALLDEGLLDRRPGGSYYVARA